VLYKGRSIVDATRAANAINAGLRIVSAGLGLVSAEDQVPNYDLTVASGSPLGDLLAEQGLGPEAWWSAITADQPFPLSALVANSMAYIALPASYLRMVREDLALIPTSACERLRIFTSYAGRSEVPASIASSVMPYDERLETVPGFDGTRVDFAQRAMRHFVAQLRGHELSAEIGSRAVAEFMNAQRRRTLPNRTRASDDEIRRLIRGRWHDYAGSSTRLLRYLRDDAKVSCEQRRFRVLWKNVLREMAA